MWPMWSRLQADGKIVLVGISQAKQFLHIKIAELEFMVFNERIDIENGNTLVPTRTGLGVTLSDQARAWPEN